MESLSRALLFGTRNSVSEETVFLFERTGLVHLLSVSGWHMAIAASAGGLAITVWKRGFPKHAHRPWAIALQLILVTGLMFFIAHRSGWSKPATRAFSAGFVLVMARGLGLSPGPLWKFSVSIAVSFALGHGSWRSFLLSALGTAALLWAVDQKRYRWAWILVAPWALTLPLSTGMFHSAAILSPLYNFLATIYFGPFVAAPAFVALLWESAGGSANWLWESADQAGSWGVVSLSWIEHLLKGAKWVPWPVFILALGLAAAWAMSWRREKRWGATILILAGFLIQQGNSEKGAVILNVGQGESLALFDGPWMVDTGPHGRTASSWAGISGKKLEGLLLTHPDQDHTGGLESMLLRFGAVQGVWISSLHIDLPNATRMLEALELHNARVHLWEMVGFPFPCVAGPGPGSNNSSPLCRVTLPSGRRLLLTGDMDARAEHYHLRNNPDFLSAELLKVAHHGSRHSSTEEFLEAVNPQMAIISAGRKRKHHPHPETLERLGGTTVRITGDEGNIYLD